MKVIKRDLRTDYLEYTSTVSDPVFAISLETVALSVAIVRTRECKKVGDLGSGFTSYAFRKLTDAEVTSVDDSEEWLHRTRTFLRAHELETEGLMTFEELMSHPDTFDFILYDLGNTKSTRRDWLPTMFEKAGDGAVIVFDDAHRRRYRALLESELAARELDSISLRGAVEDKIGRYAWLTVVDTS